MAVWLGSFLSSKPLNGLSIAIVGPLPPPAGGMASQAQQLEHLLQKNGAEVHFVRVNEPYKPSWVADIKGLRSVFRLLPYLYQLWCQISRADVVHLLANSGWSWHLFAVPAVWVGWLLKKPVVINYRGGEAEIFFERSWRWVLPTLNKGRQVIVPSAFLQRVFAKRGVPSDIVPNILDIERFDSKNKKPFDSEAPHLVVTRNLEKIYGVDTILKAFSLIRAAYPLARLTIAGSGPEGEALRQLAACLELSSSVDFCGRLEPTQIVQLYHQADVLLNASRVDNSPNSLIEALASGVPVVSSNVGGIPDLVEHNHSALLVESDAPEALAEATLQVLNDRNLRDKLVKQGKQVALRFDKYSVLDKLATVYQEVVAKP